MGSYRIISVAITAAWVGAATAAMIDFRVGVQQSELNAPEALPGDIRLVEAIACDGEVAADAPCDHANPSASETLVVRGEHYGEARYDGVTRSNRSGLATLLRVSDEATDRLGVQLRLAELLLTDTPISLDTAGTRSVFEAAALERVTFDADSPTALPAAAARAAALSSESATLALNR